MRLLRIRNPWGKHEWNGAWSDQSKEWTPALLEQLGHKPGNDGLFFMTFEDYVRHFTTFELCKYNKDYLYSSKSLKHEGTRHHSLVKLMVEYPGEYYFTVCQKDKRQFHNTDYKYSPARLTLCQIVYGDRGEEHLKYLKSEFMQDRDSILHMESMEPGDYAILVDFDWTS